MKYDSNKMVLKILSNINKNLLTATKSFQFKTHKQSRYIHYIQRPKGGHRLNDELEII